MVARKHHFISQCYLRNFAVEKQKIPKVTVFDRRQGRIFQSGIDSIGAARDFNKVQVEGLSIDAVEKDISRFESDLAPALKRINEAQSIKNQPDFQLLINFINSLSIRTPRMREQVRGIVDQISKRIWELVLKTPERYYAQMEKLQQIKTSEKAIVPYEKMVDFFDRGEFNILTSSTFHISQELELLDSMLPLLFARKWHLLRADKSSGGFITFDHPFCIFWTDPEMRRGNYAPGLGMPKTEVIFPISNRLAMVGAFELQNNELNVTEEVVSAINGAVIAYCSNQIYARDFNFTYSMEQNEQPRKASRLIDDPRFLRRA